MSVSLSIKNVPDELAERLRARAARHHRSLQRELLSILEQAGADAQSHVPGEPMRVQTTARLSIDELIERSRQLFPSGTPGSTELLRAMRDGRYGASWARTGRQPKARAR